MSINALSYWHKINNAWKIFVIILLVNLIQAAFTPLMNDEPYYFLYARYLSWGYFDHPPMIALLIKMGMAILPGELGFRFFFVVLGSFTCFFTYRLMEGETNKPVNFTLAALLIFSSLFINLYTFVAFPDTPLLCFAAMFLYAYRRYINQDNVLNTLLLGVITALLLYSKYHGVLLIGFTVLSNIKLFKKPSFYMIMAITLVLLLPLIYWQIQNDFPTIRFHLSERNKVLSWGEPLFLPKQLIITGPVILLLFSILYKSQNQFQKTLKFIVIGVFAFFLYSSFKGFVNTNWTLIAWPPMLCLSYLYIADLKKSQPYIKGLLILGVVAMVALKINFIGGFYNFFDNIGRNPRVMSAIFKQKAKGHPLVFENMYHEPSYFMYYEHQNVYAVNNILFKKTQFNYLPQLENEFQGKTVCYVSEIPYNALSQKVSIPHGMVYYITFIPNFSSFTNVEVKADDFKVLKQGEKNVIKIEITSKLDSSDTRFFKAKNGYLALNLMSRDVEDGKIFTYKYNKTLNLTDKNRLEFECTPLIKKGHYRCTFSVMTGDKPFAGFNSHVYNIEIK